MGIQKVTFLNSYHVIRPTLTNMFGYSHGGLFASVALTRQSLVEEKRELSHVLHYVCLPTKVTCTSRNEVSSTGCLVAFVCLTDANRGCLAAQCLLFWSPLLTNGDLTTNCTTLTWNRVANCDVSVLATNQMAVRHDNPSTKPTTVRRDCPSY